MSFIPFEFRALPPKGADTGTIKGATSAGNRQKMPQLGEYLRFHQEGKGSVRLKVVLIDPLETPTRLYLEANQADLESLVTKLGWKQLT